MIRIIVVSELPRTENNALLHLLSASAEQVQYAEDHYEQHSSETSQLLAELFEGYEREGITMPYTMDDFRRDYTRKQLERLPVKERLRGLSPEERLEGLSAEDLLRAVPPEDLLAGLSPEERLVGLSPEVIAKYLKRRKKDSTPAQTQEKRLNKSLRTTPGRLHSDWQTAGAADYLLASAQSFSYIQIIQPA